MKGSFAYTAADGVVYTVNYVADEAGFHPEGDHLRVILNIVFKHPRLLKMFYKTFLDPTVYPMDPRTTYRRRPVP